MTDTPLFTTYPTQAGIQYKFLDPVPSVDVPASRERAEQLTHNGQWTAWSRDILRILERCGAEGATWQELGRILKLHHGQISGRLSTMHGRSEVFTLTKTRDGSHPYVHAMYRDDIDAKARRDQPAKTKARKLADVLEEIKAYAQLVKNAENEPSFVRQTMVDNLLRMIEDAQ